MLSNGSIIFNTNCLSNQYFYLHFSILKTWEILIIIIVKQKNFDLLGTALQFFPVIKILWKEPFVNTQLHRKSQNTAAA